MVSATAAPMRLEVFQDKTLPEEERQSLLARIDADPAQIVNAILVQETQAQASSVRSKRLAALQTSPPAGSVSGSAKLTLDACPGCDQCFADLPHRTVKGKNTTIKVLLKRLRISPEMVQAIRPASATVQTG